MKSTVVSGPMLKGTFSYIMIHVFIHLSCLVNPKDTRSKSGFVFLISLAIRNIVSVKWTVYMMCADVFRALNFK